MHVANRDKNNRKIESKNLVNLKLLSSKSYNVLSEYSQGLQKGLQQQWASLLEGTVQFNIAKLTAKHCKRCPSNWPFVDMRKQIKNRMSWIRSNPKPFGPTA